MRPRGRTINLCSIRSTYGWESERGKKKESEGKRERLPFISLYLPRAEFVRGFVTAVIWSNLSTPLVANVFSLFSVSLSLYIYIFLSFFLFCVTCAASFSHTFAFEIAADYRTAGHDDLKEARHAFNVTSYVVRDK